MNAETRATRKAEGGAPEPRASKDDGGIVGSGIAVVLVVVAVAVLVMLGMACRGCYDVTRWISAKADEARARAEYYEQEVRR